MKESIVIKHLGPLNEVSIDDIKPLTVFIGKSASGKSTIMKIVVLMRYIYKMVNIRSYLKNANISRSPFKLRFQSLLHDGLENMVTPDTEIHYCVEVNGHPYTLHFAGNKLSAAYNIPDSDLVFFKESYISETRSIIPTWVSKVAALKGASLGYYFHETFNDFNDATDIIKEQPLDYLNMRMKVQKSANKPKQFIIESTTGDPAPVELKFASSGIQTSAPLVATVRYLANEFSFKEAFQRSVLNYLYKQDLLSKFSPAIGQNELEKHVHIHIEEPELSLDPEAQRELVNTLAGIAFHKCGTDRRMGLMLATHSPYIVNHLNVLLRAGYFEGARKRYPFVEKDDVAVYRVQDGTITSLMASDNSTGEYVINTFDLSDPMERIFEEYESMEDGV